VRDAGASPFLALLASLMVVCGAIMTGVAGWREPGPDVDQ
jgi:hypothetical protein